MPASINEPDKRKSGEGAMRGWQTRHLREISHDDICRLSRVFNAEPISGERRIAA